MFVKGMADKKPGGREEEVKDVRYDVVMEGYGAALLDAVLRVLKSCSINKRRDRSRFEDTHARMIHSLFPRGFNRTNTPLGSKLFESPRNVHQLQRFSYDSNQVTSTSQKPTTADLPSRRVRDELEKGPERPGVT